MDDRKVYTEAEQDEILERAKVVGIHKAAQEYGLTWQMVTSWSRKRKAAAEALNAPKSQDAKPEKLGKSGKPDKADKSDKSKADGKASPASNSKLELENAILRERVGTLAQQVERLKKAITELI